MAAIKSTKVPKAFGEIYAVITTITDTFCRERLNEEYGELARFATAALCRKRPSPLSRGKPKTWACGVLYALGQVNFLPDKSFEPHMSLGELCELMGVGKSTGPAKAKVDRLDSPPSGRRRWQVAARSVSQPDGAGLQSVWGSAGRDSK